MIGRNRSVDNDLSRFQMLQDLKVSAYYYTIAHTEGNREFWKKEMLRQAEELFDMLNDADRRYALKVLPEEVAVEIVLYLAAEFNDPDEFLTDCRDYGLNATERIMQLARGRKFNTTPAETIPSFEEISK